MRLVLASRSPRRIELLRRVGYEPLVVPADIDETQLVGESAVDYVMRLSRQKAEATAARHSETQFPDAVVIGADTCVELDGMVHGQPTDLADAERTLRTLSGRTHNVHTAVTVLAGGAANTFVDTARVTLQPLSEHLLAWYLATGEPFGKAGAYAVQGHGGVLVTRVQGSMSTVVGLPLRQTVEALRAARPQG